MPGKTTTRSAKRVWIERSIFGVAIIALGTWVMLMQSQKGPCTIMVEDKPVASVASFRAARNVLRTVRVEGASGISDRNIRFIQQVTLRRADANAALSDLPEATGALEKAASVEAEAYTVSVDGTPIVGLPDKKQAEDTLQLVKRNYEGKVQNRSGDTTFKENVVVEKRYVDSNKILSSPQDAARMLTEIHEQPTMHTVQPGDRAVHLARQYEISLADLKKLNPGVNMERLTEGDQLLVRRAKKPVTVVTKAVVTQTININPPAEMGRYSGKRLVKMLMIYENGEPAGKEIISQITTWDRPKTSSGYSSDDSGYSSGRSHYRSSSRYSRHYRHYRRSR